MTTPVLEDVEDPQDAEAWAALVSTLKQLERENAELKETVRFLSNKLIDYGHEEDLTLIRVSGSGSGIRIEDLPDEILLLIFREVVPPQWMLNRIKELVPDSLESFDLEAKTSLALVCKQWNLIATEMLYKNIFLRRVGQVPALARTLQNTSALRLIVRHLNLSCFVPRAYQKLFEAQTNQILDMCPGLTHFGLTPLYRIPTTEYIHAFLSLKTTITRLEFTEQINFTFILASVTQLCQGLRSLSLSFTENYQDSYPYLDFLKLEELRVKQLTQDSDESMLTPTLWNWSMPVLQRLWFTSCRSDDFSESSFTLLFLKKYAASVIFLSLSIACCIPLQKDNLCPKLQHLCVEVSSRQETWFPVDGHTSLAYVDVWCQPNRASKAIPPDLKSRFPALKLCRLFDWSFRYFEELSVQFPPGLPAMRSELDMKQRGLQQQRPSFRALLQDAEQLPRPAWMTAIFDVISPASVNGQSNLDDIEGVVLPVDENPEEWTDGRFIYHRESDGDSDSTVDEGSVGCLQDGREFYQDEDWQADAEEALDIFSSMQE
ncbi:hypothetical protein MIND_00097800 [Mycena indigotica]|uniref:F-box domain-containing protein n=1 Tax=Mycena indigotica TaxID=2126181 RepID=A0A8H6TFI8_9AGAR|nr:uncharacterized protein MIND_00097800 [Mycena indigotica]KAF7315817.1 hypothetical protein MIND_00097800 [Mycena indigotica]